MPSQDTIRRANHFVYVAIAADAVIAASKFVAAGVTRSSAMLAEGIHSSIDTINSLLLLFGIHRARKPADHAHPFGYGRENYFWSLMVAIMTFAIGGGVSVFEGIARIRRGGSPEDATWNYVVLGISAVFGTASLVVSLRRFRRERRGDESVWATFRRSKDPSVYTVMFEDVAALVGVVVAFLGVFIAHTWHKPLADPTATIVIGLLLAAVSFVLARETKGLLLGESADSQKIDEIRRLVEANPNVEKMERPLTMQLGPSEVLLNMAIRFRRGLSITELENTVDQLERTISQHFPDVKRIFFEAESLAGKEKENDRAA